MKRGPDGTYAVGASNGREVWRFPGGKYANPVVADPDRVYVTGRAQQFAFEEKSAAEAEAGSRQGEPTAIRTAIAAPVIGHSGSSC